MGIGSIQKRVANLSFRRRLRGFVADWGWSVKGTIPELRQ